MSDLAALAVGFGELLHRAGLPTTPERSGRFARAVALVEPLTHDDLYWTARVTLVAGDEQLELFDRVFAQVFGGLGDVADARSDPAAPPPVQTRRSRQPGASSPRGSRRTDGAQPPLPARGGRRVPPTDRDPADEAILGIASTEERLGTTDFADLEAHELAALQRAMRELRLAAPMRPGRRPRRHRHGERLDLRATLAASRRSGGDPVAHIRRRRRPRPRRIVALCDISGSMEPYARAYVQFLHAAVGGSRAEVFTFATRLTRLTRALAAKQPQVALMRAVSTAPDWSGGTRIGASLKQFIDEYGRRGIARGAVVVILSDGWERDDPALLAEQMARLRRLAHRVVWINPRSADPRFEPLAGGMAAALPSCDVVVSGHHLDALDEVVAAINAPG